MPALGLEPRDAGIIEIEGISVAFEGDMKVLHGAQGCADTCKRTVCTLWPCCQTLV